MFSTFIYAQNLFFGTSIASFFYFIYLTKMIKQHEKSLQKFIIPKNDFMKTSLPYGSKNVDYVHSHHCLLLQRKFSLLTSTVF